MMMIFYAARTLGRTEVSSECVGIHGRSKGLPEVEFPVETSPGHVGGGDVLERLVWNYVDDGTDDSFPDDGEHQIVAGLPIFGPIFKYARGLKFIKCIKVLLRGRS